MPKPEVPKPKPVKPAPKPEPEPVPVAPKVVRVPVAPPMDVLEPVSPAGPGQAADVYHTTLIQHGPARVGPGTRITASASVLLLLGTSALLASASSINDRSRIEPVQTRAGELFDRSERTYQASYVMGGLAIASAVTALLLSLFEEADPEPAGLSVRF